MRELLSFYDFDGDNTPIIRGSALGALNGDAKWEEKVMELMEACDTWIPPVSYTHLECTNSFLGVFGN